MPFYFNGELIGGSRGPAGPDGNPIGTVISFMGTAAPEDYLVCDGAEYSVSDYPELAALFAEQFSTANYFGGDGTTTFAVPDLRTLFLRGYHGEAGKQLSGEVGERQEGTKIPYFFNWRSNPSFLGCGCSPSNNAGLYPDNMDSTDGTGNQFTVSATLSGDAKQITYYKTRPVNMAVLYCIKAVESISGGLEEYDTDNGWHVRKWGSGYVEMMAESSFLLKASDWNAWGSGWSCLSSKTAALAFPFPLTEKYADIKTTGNQGNTALVIWNGDTSSLSETGQYGFYRATNPNSDMDVTVKFYVTGRWK